jgi:urease beta subunit
MERIVSFIIIFDILSLATGIVAAWLWYKASARSTRRVECGEHFDFHDFNRLVVAFNRQSILNRRAALATALSILCVAGKFAVDLVMQLMAKMS